jgi:Pirin C-terminal cupin domain
LSKPAQGKWLQDDHVKFIRFAQMKMGREFITLLGGVGVWPLAARAQPVLDGEGKNGRIIAGSLLGKRSPVRVSSPMFYADMTLAAGALVPLDPEYDERAIYTVEGDIEIAGDSFSPGALLVFRPGDRITIRAKSKARFMMLGGEAMDGPRYIWWNFVSSRKERINQAKAEWKQARFDCVPGDHEFISLPQPEPEIVGPKVVNYP